MVRPSLGCEPGQGAQPDRNGEPIPDVDDGGHALRQRRLGTVQVTELQAGHAEQLEDPGLDGGQAERRGQLRRSVRTVRWQLPSRRSKCAAAPANHRTPREPASSPASVCNPSARSMSARPPVIGSTDDQSWRDPGRTGRRPPDRVMRGAGAVELSSSSPMADGTVSLVGREPRRAVERVHPLRVVGPGPARADSPSRRLPSEKCPRTDQNPVSRFARRSAMAGSALAIPVQRRAEVVVLELEQVETGPVRARRRTGEVLGQVPEHRRMGGSHPAPARQLAQLLGRELADGLQHREPRGGRGCRTSPPQQAVVDQLGQRRPAPARRSSTAAAQTASRTARSIPPRKTEHTASSRFGRLAQQVVAPGDRGAQRPLPVRHVPVIADQQAQRVLQPRQDRRRRQQLHPRGRQFDRQRQPVEASRDARDRGRVLVGDGEAGHRGGRSHREQLHRLTLGERRRLRPWSHLPAPAAAAQGTPAPTTGAAASGW